MFVGCVVWSAHRIDGFRQDWLCQEKASFLWILAYRWRFAAYRIIEGVGSEEVSPDMPWLVMRIIQRTQIELFRLISCIFVAFWYTSTSLVPADFPFNLGYFHPVWAPHLLYVRYSVSSVKSCSSKSSPYSTIYQPCDVGILGAQSFCVDRTSSRCEIKVEG